MNLFLYDKATAITSEVLEKSKWAIIFLPIMAFVERYIFSDWEFLKFLVVFIVIDTLLGFGYALYRYRVDVRKLSGVLVKIVIYGPVLIMGHIFASAEIRGDVIPGGEYFTLLCYASLLIVEAISITRNLGKINSRLVPAWILKRLEGFNENGDFKELLPKNNQEQ